MSNSLSNKNTNEDLVWSLEGITNRKEALDFLKLFENNLFIYSPTVRKIYSSYSFVFPKSEEGKIAVLPDFLNFHNIFDNVPSSCVQNTDIAIFPGDIIGMDNIVVKYPSSLGGSKTLPFRESLIDIIEQYNRHNSYFLPVISNGDLREYENRMPCLYLQNVDINEMRRHTSQLHVDALKKAISDSLIRLMTLYKEC